MLRWTLTLLAAGMLMSVMATGCQMPAAEEGDATSVEVEVDGDMPEATAEVEVEAETAQ